MISLEFLFELRFWIGLLVAIVLTAFTLTLFGGTKNGNYYPGYFECKELVDTYSWDWMDGCKERERRK